MCIRDSVMTGDAGTDILYLPCLYLRTVFPVRKKLAAYGCLLYTSPDISIQYIPLFFHRNHFVLPISVKPFLMGYQNHGSLIFDQRFFEGFLRQLVQMVRRLIQNEDIGGHQCQTAQLYFLSLIHISSFPLVNISSYTPSPPFSPS